MGKETLILKNTEPTSVCEVSDLSQSVLTPDIRTCERTHSYTYTSTKRNTCSNSGHVILCVSIFIFVIAYLSPPVAGIPSFLCHSRVKCLNGGTLHIPDGPFGFCQCICLKRFAGLRCEFNRIFSGRNRRVRRVNRLKRLVKIRKEVGNLLTDRRRHRHSQR